MLPPPPRSTLFPYTTLFRSSLAQSTFGSFTGSVKDPSGAMVPAASVEVSNEGTGVTRKVTTSSAGVFNVPNLDIGNYRIRVRSEEHTSELQSHSDLVCRLLL